MHHVKGRRVPVVSDDYGAWAERGLRRTQPIPISLTQKKTHTACLLLSSYFQVSEVCQGSITITLSSRQLYTEINSPPRRPSLSYSVHSYQATQLGGAWGRGYSRMKPRLPMLFGVLLCDFSHLLSCYFSGVVMISLKSVDFLLTPSDHQCMW